MTQTMVGLPPGCYERDGKYYRVILKSGVDERGEWEAEEEREVLLPMATDDESITRSRERAAQKGMDFYDPRVATGDAPRGYAPEVIGWLDRGRKREKEWAWNLGSGETQKRRYKTPSSPPRQRPQRGTGPVPVSVLQDMEEESNHGNG